jgi:hypothetical protein
MNKKVLFFAIARSFSMQAHWPEDFSFNVDGEVNYSCHRQSIMSQLSQEYKDSDCLTDEEIRAMAGLDSCDGVDNNEIFQVEEVLDKNSYMQVPSLSAVVLENKKSFDEIRMIFINGLVQALVLKYKQNLAMKKKEEKPE